MFFKTQEGKHKILELYHQKLQELNIDYSEKLIKTTFGFTNIIVTGDTKNPPLFLIHGTGGCAPQILESFPKLSQKYRVYAIDVLAQPNKSAEQKLDMMTLDYGKWVIELVKYLKLQEVTLVGFSFGGLISLKTLEYDESYIKEVFLIAPVYLVNGNPFKNLFQIFIPLKSFIKTGKQEKIKKVLNTLFSEYDNFALHFMSATFQHCNMDFSPLPVLKKKSAQNIKAPITIFACEDDIMFPGKKMVKRAKTLFNSPLGLILLENSKHVPNRTHLDLIQSRILK